MKTIYWKCFLGPNWQWGNGRGPAVRVPEDNVREGAITLPPDANFWFTCITVHLGTLPGYAYVRYFKEDGVDKLQAVVSVEPQWKEEGKVDRHVSSATGQGGINLIAVMT